MNLPKNLITDRRTLQGQMPYHAADQVIRTAQKAGVNFKVQELKDPRATSFENPYYTAFSVQGSPEAVDTFIKLASGPRISRYDLRDMTIHADSAFIEG